MASTLVESIAQVRDAGERRLLEAVAPVIAELIALALDSKDERVCLAACRDILDRVGLREPFKIDATRLPAPALVEQWIAALEADLGGEARHDSTMSMAGYLRVLIVFVLVPAVTAPSTNRRLK